MESLQDKAFAAITRIHRYQEQLETEWMAGNLIGIKANLRLINKATQEIEGVIKQQLYDNISK